VQTQRQIVENNIAKYLDGLAASRTSKYIKSLKCENAINYYFRDTVRILSILMVSLCPLSQMMKPNSHLNSFYPKG